MAASPYHRMGGTVFYPHLNHASNCPSFWTVGQFNLRWRWDGCQPLPLRPSDLGKYLLYDENGGYLVSDGLTAAAPVCACL